MIHYTDAVITQLIVHRLKEEEGSKLLQCTEELVIVDESVHPHLLKYFLAFFREPEFFCFTSPEQEVVTNPVYNYICNIIDDDASFVEESINIAKRIHSVSHHSWVKTGEIIVVKIKGVIFDNNAVDLVGIFKSENKEGFVNFLDNDKRLTLEYQQGMSLAKIDKGTLVFDLHRDEGFKVLNIDHSNKYREALYWKNEFLYLKPFNDSYHQTKNYIQLTKNFVVDRMAKEFDTDASQKAGVMSRAKNYFDNNERFDAEEFEINVFKDNKVVEAFKEFRSENMSNANIEYDVAFDIDEYALKKQSKVFKSVIKLDKNFHIYVHGDRTKITKGVDQEGKKYYMLYYNEEI